MTLQYLARRVLAVCVLLVVSQFAAANERQPDIGKRFREAGVEGCFVLLPGEDGEAVRYNDDCVTRRFAPASTFKIPNTLIALETGVATDAGFALEWDSHRDPRREWWPAAWAGDQDLRSALKHSVVWYYKELARRVGPQRMQAYVDRFGYGNRDISGGIDRFWLEGGLRISAQEQVAFLRRFYFGQLGLSARTTDVARQLLVLDETPDYRLSGKTGWAGLGNGGWPQTGWLVGYVERGGKVWFFATNLQLRADRDAAQRMPLTRAILRDFGLLP